MVACSKLSVWAQFSDQGSNLRPLHWKVASQPLDHQGSPQLYDSQVSPWIPGGIIPGTSYHLNSRSNLLEKKWNYLLVFYIWLNKRGLNMSQFWCPSFFHSWGQLCVCVCVCVWMFSHVFSLWPYGLQPTRLLYPSDSPGKNTGVGCIGEGNGSSQPRKWTLISCTGRQTLCHWATWDAPLGSLDPRLLPYA